MTDPDPKNNFLGWRTCAGADGAKGKDDGCSVVFKYGMKRDFNAWLATLGPKAPVKTLSELRAFNHRARARAWRSNTASRISTSRTKWMSRKTAQRYEADRAKDIALAGTRGIDAAMKQHKLDALLFPGGSGAAIAAKPGYPTVIVPFATGAERADAGVPGRASTRSHRRTA